MKISLKLFLFPEVAVCWGWHFVKMAFLKRKRFKFNVDLQLVHLSDVPLVNAVLFAKVCSFFSFFIAFKSIGFRLVTF